MQQYPKPSGYVNDFAGLLSHDQGAALNSELAAFEKRTTVEIAVVTVPSLKGHNVEDYTRGLAKEWGVGKAGRNNGVVFLIAPNERKMRISLDQQSPGACLPGWSVHCLPQFKTPLLISKTVVRSILAVAIRTNLLSRRFGLC
jgi:uncharacterized protein